MFTNTSLELSFTITKNNTALTELPNVTLIVKNKTTRAEKPASSLGGGKYYVTLSPADTTEPGNYYIQPIVTYADGTRYPGTIKSFELSEGL